MDFFQYLVLVFMVVGLLGRFMVIGLLSYWVT